MVMIYADLLTIVNAWIVECDPLQWHDLLFAHLVSLIPSMSTSSFFISLTVLVCLQRIEYVPSRFLFCFSFHYINQEILRISSWFNMPGIEDHFLKFFCHNKVRMIILGKHGFSFIVIRFPLLSMMLRDAISFIPDIRIILVVDARHAYYAWSMFSRNLISTWCRSFLSLFSEYSIWNHHFLFISRIF